MTAAHAARNDAALDQRLCRRCEKVKPVTSFRFDHRSRTRDMRSRWCSDCAEDTFWTPDKIGFVNLHHDDCLARGMWPGSCSVEEQVTASRMRLDADGPFTSIAELRATWDKAFNHGKLTPFEQFCVRISIRTIDPKTREYRLMSFRQAAKLWERMTGKKVPAKGIRRGLLEAKRKMAETLGWDKYWESDEEARKLAEKMEGLLEAKRKMAAALGWRE